nr:MAG TPA: hypothetical protein [Caudoviricetes sp.]DAW50720.1 MAG TPA: hypothetical protein [Caudoviricetes sp.]
MFATGVEKGNYLRVAQRILQLRMKVFSIIYVNFAPPYR